jgi:choline dehydrogenase
MTGAQRYDVVIVGAGSAGCALAHRLSSDPSISVALIEAGGDDSHEDILVPHRYFSLWGTDVDWGYLSTPQRGTMDRVHRMPRGKVLGGTSSLNGMVWLRGAASDYDRWAAMGCDGWGWDRVRVAFEELEEWQRPGYLMPKNPLSEAMVDAAVEAGLPRNDDFDTGLLDGAGWNRSAIHEGRRRNAYQAFIAPVLAQRPNLAVLTGVHVLRLEMDGACAAGVTVARNGLAETIVAGEIVLCAGAFDSPALLLRSGIGPAAHLAQVGIDAVADLPVGENLIDHLLIGIVYDGTREIAATNAYATEGCAFARSTPEREDCDLEISFAKEPHFAPETTDGRPRFTIIPGITRPKSRGTVRLTGSEPSAPLLIDPNYFSDPYDMQAMIAAVHLSRTIGEQAALEGWSAGEHFPGAGIESDEAIAQYVARDVSTWFHPVGTCRMGVGPDAVVAPDLRVRGVVNLRVADASVMPDIVSVNTNAASTMIGWMAGERMASGS